VFGQLMAGLGRHGGRLGLRFDLILHAEAFALDDDGVGVVQDAVEDG
jgi:hypothetical protein